MLCRGVGVGLTLDPDEGVVGVILSLHDEEDGDDAATGGFIVLPPERAVEIGMGLLARAAEGQELINEIASTPMDDRSAVIAKIVGRLHGNLN
jgi:hypothetical protein